MLAALIQTGASPVFAPVSAYRCESCDFASTAEGVFFRDEAGGLIVCRLCRTTLNHPVADAEIHLLLLPEFSQSELNMLLYTLTLKELAAEREGRWDTEAQRYRWMRDAFVQRVRDSQAELPILGALSGLRNALAAATDEEREAMLEALAGLRFIPNLEHPEMVSYFRRLSLAESIGR
ncbi:MAG: hypothetical protein GY952_05325 [Rhodobacteraceae bacterium]|nr:hypothetical protein [Paracoccaceae bacterium]